MSCKWKEVMKSPGIPEPVIPHSYASAESVAFVMKQKFVNGVPLYRQESEWKQMGWIFQKRQWLTGSYIQVNTG